MWVDHFRLTVEWVLKVFRLTVEWVNWFSSPIVQVAWDINTKFTFNLKVVALCHIHNFTTT